MAGPHPQAQGTCVATSAESRIQRPEGADAQIRGAGASKKKTGLGSFLCGPY